jgi:hypothetical protein
MGESLAFSGSETSIRFHHPRHELINKAAAQILGAINQKIYANEQRQSAKKNVKYVVARKRQT